MNKPFVPAKPLTLVQVGDSVGVVLPEDMLARLNVAIGDDVSLTEVDGGFALTHAAPAVDEQMAIASGFMAK